MTIELYIRDIAKSIARKQKHGSKKSNRRRKCVKTTSAVMQEADTVNYAKSNEKALSVKACGFVCEHVRLTKKNSGKADKLRKIRRE